MAVCEFCQNRFDEGEARVEFERRAWRLRYAKLRKCLCGNCAVRAIERQTEGVYFETCAKCGRSFDFAVDDQAFERSFRLDHHKTLRDCWTGGPLCCDCATEAAFSRA